VSLLRELQPGITLPRPAGDAGRWTDPACTVALRPQRVRDVLGAPLADQEIARILRALELGVTERGATWDVAIPSARATKDLRIEEDLIEEVGRMHGYGNVADAPLVTGLAPAPRDERRALVRLLQDELALVQGFHEAQTYSFLEAPHAEKVGVADEPHVRVVNPQIEGLDRVRRSVVPSLLAHLGHNRRVRAEVRLFEVGKGYQAEPNLAMIDPHTGASRPRERHELALVWMAPRQPKTVPFDAALIVRLRGVVESLLRAAGRHLSGWERTNRGPGWADKDRCAIARTASFGLSAADYAVPPALVATLDPDVQTRLELRGELDGEIACAWIDLDRVLELPAVSPRFRPLPRFPGVKVDVALAVPEAVSAGTVAAKLVEAGKGLVAPRDVELFDVFRGASVGGGRKSLAYHVLLQASDRTLGEAEQTKFLGRVERALAELGGELRKE
jgi:phenylalanyl-tRNA synthetase beta chain